MRGEESVSPNRKQQRMVAGHLLDHQGEIKYHLVTSMWVNGVIVAFAIIMGLCVLLMAFIYYNNILINQVKDDVRDVKQEVKR